MELKTAKEKAVETVQSMTTRIPKITDPLGKSWIQPNPDDIQIDKTHALMTKQDFNKLANYSGSQPTGAYVGKMWKSEGRDGTWYLKWFSMHEDPNMCSGNVRDILIV